MSLGLKPFGVPLKPVLARVVWDARPDLLHLQAQQAPSTDELLRKKVREQKRDSMRRARAARREAVSAGGVA